MPPGYEFELVFDPIHFEAGGMIPGKQFSRLEMVSMLAMRVLAYGTLVRYLPTGEIRRVDYDAENNMT